MHHAIFSSMQRRPTSMPSRPASIRAAAVAIALATASLTTAAQADTATPARAAQVAAADSRSYDIPSGSLSQALQAFSQQAGVRVSFDAAKLNGLTSPGLKGQHSPQAALDALLIGSGYVSKSEGNAFVLVPAPPASAMLGKAVAKAD